LSFAVAKALDTAAINGSGSGNQPLGVLNQTGVSTDTYTTAPTFGELVDMEGALMTDDADMGNLGYLTTGLMASVMKKTPIVTAMDNMIWTRTVEGEGRVNGYRALSSNLVPTGYVLFGNWSDLIVGLWSGLDIITDPYTFAKSGSVQVTVLQDVDIAVRHGESFAEIHA
jgi:HK97 family phage major capsid protein